MSGQPAVPDEAVEAAARAVYGEVSRYYLALTRRWMDAALPLIREQLASEIEAEAADQEPPWHSPPEVEQARSNALRWAARIVRGES